MCDINLLKKCLEINRRQLSQLNHGLQVCNQLLNVIKFKVGALQIQIFATRIMYQDIMELRELILIVHPHLKQITLKE